MRDPRLHKTENRTILDPSGRVRLGLSFTTAGSWAEGSWPIRVVEKTRSDTRPHGLPVRGGTGVAAHPVAQLTEQINLAPFSLQHPHRSHPPRTRTFHTIYDSLNRLADATENVSSSQTWKQEFSYDRYGNRNFVTGSGHTTTIPSGCGDPVCNPAVSATDNKLTSSGYSYDSAGNTTADAGGQTFIYDGENKQVQVNDGSTVLGQYFYDGGSKRVKKYVPSTGENTIFIYDLFGKLIAEYSTIVASSSEGKVAYLTSDHLGSQRVNTDQNGNVTARHDYHPFGEEVVGVGGRSTGLNYGDDTIRKQFAAYERDKEINLDFAQARFYLYTFGRFSSPDRSLIDQSSADPQSWNLYTYSGNSPLKYVDPLGLWKQVDCQGGSTNCWQMEEGDTLESLADLLGVSSKNISEYFQGQELVEGRVFDMSGYAAWLKQGTDTGYGVTTDREVEDIVAKWSKIEPPMGGGLKDVTKVARNWGPLGWFGKQIMRGARAIGIISEAKIPSVAELAGKQLIGSSAREALRDAINILKSFKGSPQEKAELFKEFASQITSRFPEWAARSATAIDGATIFAGEQGEALVISPSGEIFRGSYGGGWKVTTEGYQVFYDAMTKIK